jgi:hypothetical protein
MTGFNRPLTGSRASWLLSLEFILPLNNLQVLCRLSHAEVRLTLSDLRCTHSDVTHDAKLLLGHFRATFLTFSSICKLGIVLAADGVLYRQCSVSITTVGQPKRTQMPSSATPVSSVVHVSPANTGSARVSVPVVTISPAASGGLT